MVNRTIKKSILSACFQGKIILLIGARQVGKTTLLREIIKEVNCPSIWLNADEEDILAAFESAGTSTQLLQLIGNQTKLVVIDEAQQIMNIGKKLKLLHDTYPDIQIIATGSSAFDLQSNAAEPLTGRKISFYLYPLSFQEMVENKSLLETRLIYGSYPEVVNNPGKEKEILIEIAQSYLYKDILKLDNVRKPSHLDKLLKALAFQLGNEVNYHELAKTIGNIDTVTVEKYLDLLEKTYVIFKLPAFNRNLRTEIKKGKKYYFYDNGIRNVLISNFTNLDFRLDKGALWENYLISERLKFNSYQNNFANTYFWRTYDQAEIDYIEDKDGILNAYDIKWSDKKVRFPNSFKTAYLNHTTNVISKENFEGFIS